MKNHICAVEETSIKAIFAIIYTTESVVEIRLEKNQANSGQLKKFNSTTSSVVFITARIASVFKNGVATIVNSYCKYWWRCVYVSVIFKSSSLRGDSIGVSIGGLAVIKKSLALSVS